MAKTLIERAQTMIDAVERLEERRDELLGELVRRAQGHAKALDPDGSRYLRYRVPHSDISLHVKKDEGTLTIKGLTHRQGGPDSEEWTMPLDLANAPSAQDADAWLADTAKVKQAEAAARKRRAEVEERRAAANRERAERAELARLQAKYGGAASGC